MSAGTIIVLTRPKSTGGDETITVTVNPPPSYIETNSDILRRAADQLEGGPLTPPEHEPQS